MLAFSSCQCRIISLQSKTSQALCRRQSAGLLWSYHHDVPTVQKWSSATVFSGSSPQTLIAVPKWGLPCWINSNTKSISNLGPISVQSFSSRSLLLKHNIRIHIFLIRMNFMFYYSQFFGYSSLCWNHRTKLNRFYWSILFKKWL